MNREGTKDTKEEPPQGGKEEDAVLALRSWRLRGSFK